MKRLRVAILDFIIGHLRTLYPVQYNKFNYLYIKLANPDEVRNFEVGMKIEAINRAEGSINVTGCRTEEEARLAEQEYRQIWADARKEMGWEP